MIFQDRLGTNTHRENSKIDGVFAGLVDQELYNHEGGWPADSPGAFDHEQVNLAVTAKGAHANTISTLAAQLKAHYSADR